MDVKKDFDPKNKNVKNAFFIRKIENVKKLLIKYHDDKIYKIIQTKWRISCIKLLS